MKLSHCLGTVVAFLQVTSIHANDTGIDSDRYTLPPSKVNIESCQNEALLRYPGEIRIERMRHRHGHYRVEYEVLVRDGSEWLVLCDLTTGKIIREQKLVDDSD